MLVVPALRGSTASRAVPSARSAPLTPLAGAERFALGRRIPLFEARHAAAFRR